MHIYTSEETLVLFISKSLLCRHKKMYTRVESVRYQSLSYYDQVLKVKVQCYPPVEYIFLIDTYAEAKMLDLLYYGWIRVCKNIVEKTLLRSGVQPLNYTMIRK